MTDAETTDAGAADARTTDAGATGAGTDRHETVDFAFELGERDISFVIDEEVYALDALYGACYLFIDRCYVLLTRPGDKRVGVRLRSKQATTGPEALEALAGEFANELLNQVLRLRIGRATAAIREQYMARAFFSSRGQNETIAQLLAELDAEELEEAPLEIPVPWEDDQAGGPEKTETAAEADG